MLGPQEPPPPPRKARTCSGCSPPRGRRAATQGRGSRGENLQVIPADFADQRDAAAGFNRRRTLISELRGRSVSPSAGASAAGGHGSATPASRLIYRAATQAVQRAFPGQPASNPGPHPGGSRADHPTTPPGPACAISARPHVRFSPEKFAPVVAASPRVRELSRHKLVAPRSRFRGYERRSLPVAASEPKRERVSGRQPCSKRSRSWPLSSSRRPFMRRTWSAIRSVTKARPRRHRPPRPAEGPRHKERRLGGSRASREYRRMRASRQGSPLRPLSGTPIERAVARPACQDEDAAAPDEGRAPSQLGRAGGLRNLTLARPTLRRPRKRGTDK